eukprot:Pgem_evm1s19956
MECGNGGDKVNKIKHVSSESSGQCSYAYYCTVGYEYNKVDDIPGSYEYIKADDIPGEYNNVDVENEQDEQNDNMYEAVDNSRLESSTLKGPEPTTNQNYSSVDFEDYNNMRTTNL